MRLLLVSFLMVLLAASGCSEEKRRTFLKKKVNYQASVFNMQHYFSDHEYSMSFPLWFNEEVLTEKKINEIRVKVFPSSQGVEVIENSPKHVKVYTFNQDGEVTSVHFEQFYENTKVGSYLFDYSTEKDENGFSKVEKTVGPNSDQKASEHYSIYEKEKYGDKFLIYKDEFSGDYLFYMLNRNNWGALSVDSIFNPTVEDKIVFGSPFIPHKSYRVENVVKELDVVEFSYDKSDSFVQEVKYDEYPFRNKRTITYDEKGVCVGFVDSTFSGQDFLKADLTSFKMESELPVKIVHESKSNESTSSYFHVETIEYVFFEEK